MTKFRCPYCKETFGPEPSARCPHCGKDMVVPGHLRKTTLKDRQRMRDKIARDADRERRSLLQNDIRPGQNPAIIGLMVLAFIILGGMLVGRVNSAKQAAGRPTREMRAEKELQALRIALELFRIDCGRYPTETEGLQALVLDPGVTNWGGHYVNIIKPDPWRTPYHYATRDVALDGDAVRLFSHGADRRSGTEDDLHAAAPIPEEIQAVQEKRR